MCTLLAALVANPKAEFHVLLRGHVREQAVGLEDHAHVALVGRLAEHVLTVHEHLARVGPLEAGDDPQRRRLAAAARSEQGDELAGVNLEVEIVERDDIAEGTTKPTKLDGCHAGLFLVRDRDTGRAAAAPAEQVQSRAWPPRRR